MPKPIALLFGVGALAGAICGLVEIMTGPIVGKITQFIVGGFAATSVESYQQKRNGNDLSFERLSIAFLFGGFGALVGGPITRLIKIGLALAFLEETISEFLEIEKNIS